MAAYAAKLEAAVQAGGAGAEAATAGDPATGESKLHRAQRKAKEVAAAARQAKEEVERLEREEKNKEAAAFNLYEGLPAPDPEKDAVAAKLAELANRDKDVPQLVYKEDRSKIIFLDIDGVLRPLYGAGFQISSIMMDGENVPIVDGDTEFLPSAMTALRIILEQTGAAIVLSSEWRRHPTLRDGVAMNLRRKGLPPFIDETPPFERSLTGNPLRSFAIRRAREIGAWLRGHPEVKQWVVLDDIDLTMADEERQTGQPLMAPRFVLTEKSDCLTKQDAALAVSILLGNLQKAKSTDDFGFM